ncbi:hypothetical protein EOD41_15020 [Mucilaginibacter limnophilus]|uniref:O-antigen ligase-related domain-containing protein n=1 Tax=Mucilaginibacter limnophilus TaxID=1932778 RepID=A0A437MQ39_9SPHI|nr:O-antigen ligase family protein [Mucilaginibacter limnophilus]RVT99754.1 hypothetical protein EOD41_15020 [Mucilaginibacter limnophilus]
MTNSLINTSRAQKWIPILGVLIFAFASFRAPGVTNTAPTYSIPTLFSLIQSVSLSLIGGALLGTFIIILITKDRIFFKKPSAASICYLIFGQILVLTDFFYSFKVGPMLLDLSFNFIIFYYFSYIISSYKFNGKGVAFLNISFYGILCFVGLNLILYLFNIGSMVWKGRFFGLTSQPNFIGMCGGVMSVLASALFIESKTFNKKFLLSLAILAGFLLAFLAQSRSSMLSAFTGCAFIAIMSLQNQHVRFFSILTCFCIAVFLYFNVNISDYDYTDRGNTREGTWKTLETYAKTFPIFGYGREDIPTSNSYMFAFVSAGVVGSFFLFASLILGIRKLIILHFVGGAKLRHATAAYGGLIFFFLTGAIFEGLLLDNVSIPVFVFWAILSFA